MSHRSMGIGYKNCKSGQASESKEVSEQEFMGFDAEIASSDSGAS